MDECRKCILIEESIVLYLSKSKVKYYGRHNVLYEYRDFKLIETTSRWIYVGLEQAHSVCRQEKYSNRKILTNEKLKNRKLWNHKIEREITEGSTRIWRKGMEGNSKYTSMNYNEVEWHILFILLITYYVSLIYSFYNIRTWYEARTAKRFWIS